MDRLEELADVALSQDSVCKWEERRPRQLEVYRCDRCRWTTKQQGRFMKHYATHHRESIPKYRLNGEHGANIVN